MLTNARIADPIVAGSLSDDSAQERGQSHPRTLMDLYSEYFEVVRADTPELLREAHKLRYQVYCVENPFENPDEHPDGLEKDEFDPHSVQSLLIHRSSGTIAGTVRLILPRADRGDCGLPMLSLCRDPDLLSGKLLPRGSTAEISRFAISKAFRRRAEDAGATGVGPMLSPGVERRVIPHITLGLMKAVAWMSHDYDIDHLCAVMEPALLRLLSRFGLDFTPVGPLVAHHGRRQPCYAHVDTLGRGILTRKPEALDVITDAGRYHTVAA
jgi:N-acyl amino acid synthase of PEP-CTERM/exosortase system